MSKTLFILTKDWARHGLYSGYQQLVNFIEFGYILSKGFFLPYRISRFLNKKTKLLNYKSDTISKEFSLLFSIFRRKTIYVLYGDMDYYYLHYIKRFPFNFCRNTLIATFHHPPYELEQRMGYDRRKVLGVLDKIIVMGPNQIPFFQKYTKAKIRFIPHGIDLNYFKPNPNVIKIKQFLIIGISHRDHQRNIAIIEAFPKDLACRFVVVMPLNYAKQYEHLDCVELVTENITDTKLLSYYHESNGLLLSLKDCTASNTLLEALACGCPLIINNVGAVASYIPKDSGVPVFETGDIEESVSYMVKLLEDPLFVNDISHKQTELAKKYDWKLIAKATEDFILQ